jgi:predicted RNA-binding protein with PIN domain
VAIEFAFAIAVAGARLKPPLPSPPALRPYLRFQKLPGAALGPVRRAVDSDDAFRERVAASVTEDLVGRLGWLWLSRPDGWEAEATDLVSAEEADASAVAEERQERTAARRLEAAEAATRRATGELASVRAELATAQDRRSETESLRTRLERKVVQLQTELDGARRRLAETEGERADASARAAAAVERSTELQARLGVVEAQWAEAEARARVAEAALELARLGGEAPGAAPSSPASLPPERPTSWADGPSLVAALNEAAAATERLGQALAAAASAVGPLRAEEECWPADMDVAAEPIAPAAHGRARRPRRRTPLRLPGGLFADTTEAAIHLVRQPDVLLIVDGYNVAKLGWPDEALSIQRERLLDALDELVARYATSVHVVFDGADVVAPAPGRRRQLRVDFSPAGVSADDVIVELAETLPAEQAVIVATNDGEVRAGARAAGANVLSSQQLLAAARR